MNLGMILILVASLAAAPSPSPSPAADACSFGGHVALLSALNRPTIGFSPCAVKPRESVFELGYSAQSGDTPLGTFPQGDLRFGVAPGWEFDLLGPNYGASTQTGGPRGFFDSGVGAKYEFFAGPRSAGGVDILYTVPTGAAAFTAGAPTETINLDYGRSLSGVLGLGTTLGMLDTSAAARDGRVRRLGALLPSLVLTDQFNPRAQFYAEAFAQTKLRPDGGALFGLDGGIQYLAAPALELDLEAGRTITDRARNHYLGAGFGIRF